MWPAGEGGRREEERRREIEKEEEESEEWRRGGGADKRAEVECKAAEVVGDWQIRSWCSRAAFGCRY